ncbi:MAG: sigma-70 family RNA polymerase sigma factor [Myxococcota bacterium]
MKSKCCRHAESSVARHRGGSGWRCAAASRSPYRPGAKVDAGPHKAAPGAERDWNEDAELLEAWRGGDARAGRTLHQRHVGAVTRFFEKKVGQGHEDLVQMTFLRLIEGRDRVREGIAVRAFVMGIARNVLLEHIRRRATDDRVEPQIDEMPSSMPSPVAVIGRGVDERRVREALQRLPETHRRVLELFYWQGMHAGKIAEVMGISHSAMRSRLVKARGLLRAAMNEAESKKPWTPEG